MERGTISQFNASLGLGYVTDASGRQWMFSTQIVPADAAASLRVGVEVLYTHDHQNVLELQLAKAAACPTTRGSTPPTETPVASSLPYDFVPVPQDSAQEVVQAITDRPVWHDGTMRYLSGELRCTLTTLTPLLAANAQYPVQDLSGLPEPANPDCPYLFLPATWGWHVPVKPNKQVLEPLRLEDGRVVIPGTALKGMIRQSLSALLATPMERVEDKAYSYRPNLSFQDRNPKLDVRPAVVVKQRGDSLSVRVLPDARAAIFVQGDAFNKIKLAPHPNPRPGTRLTGTMADLVLDDSRGRRRIRVDTGGKAKGLPLHDYYYFTYTGGIDGKGFLQRAFGMGGGVYQHVVVHQQAWNASKHEVYDIEPHVIAHYRATQRYLADQHTGHVRREHPLSDKAPFHSAVRELARRRDTLPGIHQLIYVEIDAKTHRVVSFGHHFRYRWRYRDTIRTRWTPGQPEGQERAIVKPVDAERSGDDQTDDHQPPPALSGARLFFGYVADSPGTQGIGRGDFAKLAGRVACNMALEWTSHGQDDARFLNPEKGAVVPLKILGTPRPSAVEHYLDQSQLSERKDGGRHVTYGDLPGADPLSEPAGELKGRKFYVHQPAARTDRTCYEASEVDLEFLDADAKAKSKLVDTLHELGLSRIQPTDGALTLAQQIICGDQLESLRRRVGDRRRPLPEGVKRFVERLEGFHGDQSTLARFVSKPLTQFRFTLRFRDLRPWELGALLAVLNPGRLQNLPEHLAPELKRYFQELPQEDSADAPRFALKLGHGRPLGLGSVHIAVDQALVWQGQSQDAQLVPMASSQEQDVSRVWSTQLQRLDTATLKQWLEAHRYQGRDRSEYPSTNGKIYEYHTEERRQHAKGRRGFPTP